MIRPGRARPPEVRISVITDISANVFAVFMLILIVVLAAASHPPAPPVPVSAEADLGGVERPALSAEAMVELLLARTGTAGAPYPLRIDLFADGITIARRGAAERRVTGAADIAAALAQAPRGGDGPAALYVFSHAHLAAARQALGPEAVDLSVPSALRGRDGAGREGWSPGFAALIGQPLARPAFIAELARLLDAAATPDRRGGADGGGFGGDHAGQRAGGTAGGVVGDLLTRLALWWRGVSPWLAIAGGLAFVIAVERRARR